MQIEVWTEKNVLHDGRTKGGGAVVTHGRIARSTQKGGCGLESCNCSPGHYITITLPRTPRGEVMSVIAHFTSLNEMKRFWGGEDIEAKRT